MNTHYFIEVGIHQRNHDRERICGDLFLSQKLPDERRVLTVLADGMGHGIKANILATLTAKMAMNFSKENRPFDQIAETIMRTLPICKDRKISYSTFTIIDIQIGGETRILEYGNPETLILRGRQIFDPHWIPIYTRSKHVRQEELKFCCFQHHLDDRIVSFSDGITQSGMGLPNFLLGWGHAGVQQYLVEMLSHDPHISARHLAQRLVNRAHQNDQYKAKDDTSASVIYFRTPRRLLLFTGPPYDPEHDQQIAQQVADFDGAKVVCGASTAGLLSRLWAKPLLDDPHQTFGSLPPSSLLEGIDLVTEGVITLNAVAEMLQQETMKISDHPNAAEKLYKILLENDEIHIILGNQINPAHFNPENTQPLALRQTVVKRIVKILEDKHLKEITVLTC